MLSENQISDNLKKNGYVLPTPPKPIANYVPYVRQGNVVTISGQIPLKDGKVMHQGRLGDSVTQEQGQEAARICLLNLLAQLQSACDGDLSRVAAVIRLGGFIASTPEFTDHAKVMNGASDLIVEILGDVARHARSTVGVTSLPAGAAVEVEGTFLIN